MSISESNLVWLDLEMSGLDIEGGDRILEIACVVTNSNLDIIADGPVFAIHQSDEILDSMDKWNTEHHHQSGLVNRVRQSTTTELDAEMATLAFIQNYVPAQKTPLCGNSIHVDRRYLCKYMPTLEQFFHYRNLDVSTIKILAQHWAPEIAVGTAKVSQHIALSDIYDSIDELRYYRDHLFSV